MKAQIIAFIPSVVVFMIVMIVLHLCDKWRTKQAIQEGRGYIPGRKPKDS
jgi:hypothetical protein